MPFFDVTPDATGAPAVNCNSLPQTADTGALRKAGRLAGFAVPMSGKRRVSGVGFQREAGAHHQGAFSIMKIKKLIEERRLGERMATAERADPSEAQVLAAVDQLDGAQFSSMALVTEDKTVMAVGGGDGAFVVTITLDDDARIYTLVDPTRSEDHDQDLVVGGQSGSYQQYQCVDRALAVAAVLYFQQEGEPSPELQWVSE